MPSAAAPEKGALGLQLDEAMGLRSAPGGDAELCVGCAALPLPRSPGRLVYIYKSMDGERGGVVGGTRAMFDDD
jgi:hypothetical protein